MENDRGFYEIHYSFVSALVETDGDRYITSYNLDIYERQEEEKLILVGKAHVKLVLITQAIDNGYPLFDVFDNEGYLFDIGQEIFDFEILEFNDDIVCFYDSVFLNFNLCLIERLEILQKYRNKGLGKKVIKDIHNRFASSCGLIVVQTYPLQFEGDYRYCHDPDWDKQMGYDKLDRDFEKSFYQLKAFYQKLGFDHIEGYEHLMFMNTGIINKKLEKVTYG